MTKKDYELIAEAIKYVRSFSNSDQLTMNNIMMELVFRLHKDNLKFSAEKFIKACEL